MSADGAHVLAGVTLISNPVGAPLPQISPVLSMLHELVAERRARTAGEGPRPGPHRVIMVWASRQQAEFTLLDQAVIAAARCALAPGHALFPRSHSELT